MSADKIRDWLVARCLADNSKCESPIESLFFAAHALLRPTLPNHSAVHFAQQVKIGQYRADFVFTVEDPAGKSCRLVVEIDGHDFHERTKEQAQRDKARDRYMTGEGIQVMRYTGSEIWANPFAAIEEIYTRCFVIKYGRTEKQARAKAALDDLAKFFAEGTA